MFFFCGAYKHFNTLARVVYDGCIAVCDTARHSQSRILSKYVRFCNFLHLSAANGIATVAFNIFLVCCSAGGLVASVLVVIALKCVRSR